MVVGQETKKVRQKIKQGASKRFGRQLAVGFLINADESVGMEKGVFIASNTQK